MCIFGKKIAFIKIFLSRPLVHKTYKPHILADSQSYNKLLNRNVGTRYIASAARCNCYFNHLFHGYVWTSPSLNYQRTRYIASLQRILI